MRGNEELAFCINRYMEGMVKNLSKFGGDIIKFVGDAMIVMWPRKMNNNFKHKEKEIGLEEEEVIMDEEDEKVHIIRKAI
jgi:adenylate cyclase 10